MRTKHVGRAARLENTNIQGRGHPEDRGTEPISSSPKPLQHETTQAVASNPAAWMDYISSITCMIGCIRMNYSLLLQEIVLLALALRTIGDPQKRQEVQQQTNDGRQLARGRRQPFPAAVPHQGGRLSKRLLAEPAVAAPQGRLQHRENRRRCLVMVEPANAATPANAAAAADAAVAAPSNAFVGRLPYMIHVAPCAGWSDSKGPRLFGSCVGTGAQRLFCCRVG